MIDNMSLKNKNVIRLNRNVEMFSRRIIFAFYYYRSIDFVHTDLLQKYQLTLIINSTNLTKIRKNNKIIFFVPILH